MSYDNEMSFQEALEKAMGHSMEGSDMTIPEGSREILEGSSPEQEAEKPAEEAQQLQEAPPAQQAPQAESAQDTANDRSWAKLMARESALLERERKLEERERSVQQPAQSNEHWKDDLRIDPVSFMKEHLGDAFDPDDLGQSFWYEAKGKAAPATYLAMKEARATRLENARALRGIAGPAKSGGEEEKPAQQEADVLHQYVEHVKEFTHSDVLKKYPLVEDFAEQYGKEGVIQSLLTTARSMASKSNGTIVPSAEQAAAEFEQELQKLHSRWSSRSTPSVAKEQEQQSQPEPTTIRNKHQSVQSDKVEEDPMSDDYLHKKAMRALGIPEDQWY